MGQSLAQITPFLWEKWAILVVICLLATAWRYYELKSYKDAVEKDASELTRQVFKRSRYYSLGFFVIIVILACSIIFYDVTSLSPKNATNHDTGWSPLPPTDLQTKSDIVHQNPLTEMYTSNDAVEVQLDLVKQRYEEAFITYFYLRRCGNIDPQDFHIINKALFNELVTLNTSATLQQSILVAAKGSYTEMYSQAPCNEQKVNQLTSQYNEYMNQLRSLNNKKTEEISP